MQIFSTESADGSRPSRDGDVAAVLNSPCTVAPIANRYTPGHLYSATEEMVATRPTSLLWAVLIIASFLSVVSAQAAQPLFDAHLHFDAEDATHYTPGGS